MQVYLDESGHSRNTGAVVIAGLAGFEYQWDGFDEAWTRILASHGVTAFHMTDFENRKRAFKDWDEAAQKRPLISALMNLILGRNLLVVGVGVSVNWFEQIPRADYPGNQFFENPYHLALQETVQLLGSHLGPDFGAKQP